MKDVQNLQNVQKNASFSKYFVHVTYAIMI